MTLYSRGDLLNICISLCVSESPSGFRLFLLILSLSVCSIVRCQERTRVRTIAIDSNFSVTPGLPNSACPKSKARLQFSLSAEA